MFRAFGILICAIVIGIAAPRVSAQDAPQQAQPLFPKVEDCKDPGIDLELRPEERDTWNNCEKWVWSCIVNGQEANLFEKACTTPRMSGHVEIRYKWQLAPFVEPTQYKTTNALSSNFLKTILTVPYYQEKITTDGVRIFGGYFAEPVNLENLRVKSNLVLDGAMMQRGLRLTNFRSEHNVSLDGTNIRGSIYLMRARIEGAVFMEYGAYDTVDLRDSQIGASFQGMGSVYNGELRFDRARIEGKLVLRRARLTMVRGVLSRISGSLDMHSSDIRVGLDLNGATIEGDVRMPEMAFGRRPKLSSAFCDWNPDADTGDLLNRLWKTLPPDAREIARRDIAVERPMTGGKFSGNICETTEKNGAFKELNTALLVNMKIEGTLCLVDVSGEVAGPDAASGSSSIATISLDGTSAKSTILRWKKSESETLWHAVNFKTGHMIVNLDERPRQTYFDQMEFGNLIFMTRDAAKKIVSRPSGVDTDEELHKTKCDVTPAEENTQDLRDRSAQDRIIEFFARNTSRSIQPFANLIERLETTGLDTANLRIAMNRLKYRDSCQSSGVARSYRQDNKGIWQALKAFELNDTSNLVKDSICAAGLYSYAYVLGYGQEPLNIIFYLVFGTFAWWLFRALRREHLARESQNTIGGADVFISYSKTDKALAEDLAYKLRRKGYSVWWDSSLVSGENFRTIILQELATAKAVIVIWTENSVKSEWVISEAQRGSTSGKLLPLRASKLNPNDIPPPFDVRHTELIDDFDTILHALQRKKITPSLAADTIAAAKEQPA